MPKPTIEPWTTGSIAFVCRYDEPLPTGENYHTRGYGPTEEEARKAWFAWREHVRTRWPDIGLKPWDSTHE